MLLASAAGDGNFNFTKTHVQVEEAPFTEAVFGISRTGATTGIVVVTCKVGVTHFTLQKKAFSYKRISLDCSQPLYLCL